MSVGVEAIAAERERQVQLGWTPNHDRAEHGDGSLIEAAISYLNRIQDPRPGGAFPIAGYWVESILAKAGALLAAEIDRLQEPEQRERP